MYRNTWESNTITCACGRYTINKDHLPILCPVCSRAVGGQLPLWATEVDEILGHEGIEPGMVVIPPKGPNPPNIMCRDCRGEGKVWDDIREEWRACDCTRP